MSTLSPGQRPLYSEDLFNRGRGISLFQGALSFLVLLPVLAIGLGGLRFLPLFWKIALALVFWLGVWHPRLPFYGMAGLFFLFGGQGGQVFHIGALSVPMAGLDFCIWALLAAWLFRRMMRGRPPWVSHPVCLWLLLFWLGAAFSLLPHLREQAAHLEWVSKANPPEGNPDWFRALFHAIRHIGPFDYLWPVAMLLRLAQLALFFPYCLDQWRDPRQQRRLLYFMGAGFLISALAGVLDARLLWSLEWYRPFTNSTILYTDSAHRLQSFFGHAGWYGQYAALAAPFFLARALAFYPVRKIGLRVACSGAYLFSGLAILWTFQRGAWFAFAAASILIYGANALLCLKRRQSRKWGKRLLWTGLALFLVLLAALKIVASRPNTPLGWRMGESLRYEHREDIWKSALELFHRYPPTGVGLGYYFQTHNREFPEGHPYYHLDKGTAHNTFFHILAETGLPGLVPLLIFLLLAAWELARGGLRTEPDRPENLSIFLGLGALAVFLTYGMAQNLLYIHSVAVVFFLLLALGLSNARAITGPAPSRFGRQLLDSLKAFLNREWHHPGQSEKMWELEGHHGTGYPSWWPRLFLWGKSHPFLAAWSGAFAFIALFSWPFLLLPAYHDAILNWDTALALHKTPWYPFMPSPDTGHPPLVAWILGVLWWLPFPKIILMHGLTWAFAALFVGGVYLAARKGFGRVVGLCAAGLTFLHPVVYSQSQQFNLDIPLAGCALWMLAAAVWGRPWLLALASTGACLVKLNGMFALGPFMTWAFLVCLFGKRRLRPRLWFSAFWPLLFPLVIFGGYHAAKFLIRGYWFEDGTLFGGNQIALVSNWTDLQQFLTHSWHMFFLAQNSPLVNAFWHMDQPNPSLLAGNGILTVSALLMVNLFLLFALLFRKRLRQRLLQWFQPDRKREDALFWQGQRPASVLALFWLIAIQMLMLQSIRDYWTLVRYFMTSYPAFIVTLFALTSLLLPKMRRLGLLALFLLLALLFAFKWHPAHTRVLPDSLANKVRFPSEATPTNYENNLELADHLRQVRAAFRFAYDHIPFEIRTPIYKCPWPYAVYAQDLSHGMHPGLRHYPGYKDPPRYQPDAILLFSPVHFGKEPEDLLQEYPGYELGWMKRKGRIWAAVLFPEKTASPQ